MCTRIDRDVWRTQNWEVWRHGRRIDNCDSGLAQSSECKTRHYRGPRSTHKQPTKQILLFHRARARSRETGACIHYLSTCFAVSVCKGTDLDCSPLCCSWPQVIIADQGSSLYTPSKNSRRGRALIGRSLAQRGALQRPAANKDLGTLKATIKTNRALVG